MLLHSDFFASDITPHLYLLFLSLLLFYCLIFPSNSYYLSRSLIFLSIYPTVLISIRPFVCLSVFPSSLRTYSFLPSPFFSLRSLPSVLLYFSLLFLPPLSSSLFPPQPLTLSHAIFHSHVSQIISSCLYNCSETELHL